jgi:hypothetical protein
MGLQGLGLGSEVVTLTLTTEADDGQRLCFSPHVHVRFRGRHHR